MNDLLARLAKLRWRYRLVTLGSAIFALVAFLACAITAESVFDYYNKTSPVVRAFYLVSLMGVSAWLVYWLALEPLARRTDSLSLALRVEEAFPELNDSLASTVQFIEHPERDPTAAAFRQKLVGKVVEQTTPLNFSRILPYPLFVTLAALALLHGSVAAYLFAENRSLAPTALLRLADPFGHHTWTAIEVQNARAIWPLGTPFKLQGQVLGIKPDKLRLELQMLDPKTQTFQTRVDRPLKLASSKNGLEFQAEIADIMLKDKPGKVRYRLTGNDGQFPAPPGKWHDMEFMLPPKIATTQIEVDLPDYLGLPSPESAIRVLQVKLGSVIHYQAETTRPVGEAILELSPTPKVDSPTGVGAVLALLAPSPQALLANAFVTQSAIGRIPMEIDSAGTRISARFMALVPGEGYYRIRLVDRQTPELAFTEQWLYRVENDDVPRVYLDPNEPLAQAGAEEDAAPVNIVVKEYLPDAEIQFDLDARDLYGIRSVFLEFTRKPGEDKPVEPTQRRFLCDPRRAGAILRHLAGTPIVPEALARIAPGQFRFKATWPLNQQFQEGDIILVQACADDYFDVFTIREPGRSRKLLEIHIVGEPKIVANLDQEMANIKQALDKIKENQQKAQDLVKDLKPEEKGVDPKEQNQKIENQANKALKEQEGLKKNVADLQKKLADTNKMLEENKWPAGEEKDLVQKLQNDLKDLQEKDLKEIDAALEKMRENAAKGKKEPPTKQPSPLEKSKDLQNNLQKKIDELNKSVAKWSDLAQTKNELRQLIEEQERLAEETKKSAEKFQKLDDLGVLDPKAKQEKKQEMANLADRQRALGQRTQKFMEGLKDQKARFDNKEDRETSQKLAQTKKIADDERLVPQMTKEIPDKLAKDNKINEAKQDQADAKQNLQKMLDQLEGKREDGLDRLQKDKEKIQNAKNDIDNLQKNEAKAAELKDQKKQADEFDRLAEKAREQEKNLRKLGEQEAAQEMAKAAQKLEEAAEKVRKKEDPKELEQEAKQHLDKAKRKVEETEEHLQREHLLKLAQRLKFIKERQESALERTQALQKKVQTKKIWSASLLRTLEGDQRNQVSIAKDTESLQDKLRDTIVIEKLLEMSAKTMERASQRQADRKTSGEDRLAAPFEPEQLEDENRRHAEIANLQDQAGKRLSRLLEAIDEQLQQMKPPEEKKQVSENKQPMNPENKEPQGGRRPPQDGIPPMAHLKALKSEQEEILRRTREFGQRNANLNNLPDDQRNELNALTEEQNTLRNLFDQLIKKQQEGVQ